MGNGLDHAFLYEPAGPPAGPARPARPGAAPRAGPHVPRLAGGPGLRGATPRTPALREAARRRSGPTATRSPTPTRRSGRRLAQVHLGDRRRPAAVRLPALPSARRGLAPDRRPQRRSWPRRSGTRCRGPTVLRVPMMAEAAAVPPADVAGAARPARASRPTTSSWGASACSPARSASRRWRARWRGPRPPCPAPAAARRTRPGRRAARRAPRAARRRPAHRGHGPRPLRGAARRTSRPPTSSSHLRYPTRARDLGRAAARPGPGTPGRDLRPRAPGRPPAGGGGARRSSTDEEGELTRAILRLAARPAERARLGAAARDFIRREHSPERCRDGYEAALDRARARPLPPHPAWPAHWLRDGP